MGCCESIPDAPKNIIPDPGEKEAIVCAIDSVGMMSSDYQVWQGENTTDEEMRWFFLNKTGSVWSGAAVIDLENFKRGGNSEQPNKGEVLYSAKFEGSPQFERQYKSPTSEFTGFFSGWGVDAEDPQDSVYFDKAGFYNDGGYRRVLKWKLTTTAAISPGNRKGDSTVLKVYACGTSVCEYDRRTTEEGQVEWSYQEAEFVDQLCFNLEVGGSSVDTWSVPGDTAEGEMELRSKLFTVTKAGGWLSSQCIVKTKQDWDPMLALLVAFLCSTEYSPKAIKSDLNSNFPEDPTSWGDGGW